MQLIPGRRTAHLLFALPALVAIDVAPVTAQVRVVRSVVNAQRVRIFSQHLRSLAMTADGSLWCLHHFDDGTARGDASRSLRLLVSSDGARSWRAVTQMREVGALRGSLTTDVDGRTLHFAYEARQNRGH